MNDYVILADVTCDLSEELRTRFGVEDYLQGHIHFSDGRDFPTTLDWSHISRADFYKALSDKKLEVSTAPASPEEYYTAFKAYAEKGMDVLSISISSKISSTYNVASGAAKRVQEDLGRWNAEIAPLLGGTNVLVYAKNSDLEAYSGEKFDALTQAGFRFFLGMCNNHESWLQMNSTYIRQGRILVNGANLANNTYFYTGLFDPTTLEDPSR